MIHILGRSIVRSITKGNLKSFLKFSQSTKQATSLNNGVQECNEIVIGSVHSRNLSTLLHKPCSINHKTIPKWFKSATVGSIYWLRVTSFEYTKALNRKGFLQPAVVFTVPKGTPCFSSSFSHFGHLRPLVTSAANSASRTHGGTAVGMNTLDNMNASCNQTIRSVVVNRQRYGIHYGCNWRSNKTHWIRYN